MKLKILTEALLPCPVSLLETTIERVDSLEENQINGNDLQSITGMHTKLLS